MKLSTLAMTAAVLALFLTTGVSLSSQSNSVGNRMDGKHLFELETFGGNGRTCLTCHSRATGTVSPQDAQARFLANPADPLFAHDGSDDGQGNGVTTAREPVAEPERNRVDQEPVRTPRSESTSAASWPVRPAPQ
jgi:cytochrome c peroxidase